MNLNRLLLSIMATCFAITVLAQSSSSVETANRYLQGGQYEKALAVGKKLLLAKGASWQAHRICARALFMLDRPSEAKVSIEKAIEKAPLSEIPNLKKGADEIRALGQALALANNARKLASQGRTGSAGEIMREAFHAFPPKVNLAIAAASYFEEVGRFEEAGQVLEEALAQDLSELDQKRIQVRANSVAAKLGSQRAKEETERQEREKREEQARRAAEDQRRKQSEQFAKDRRQEEIRAEIARLKAKQQPLLNEWKNLKEEYDWQLKQAASEERFAVDEEKRGIPANAKDARLRAKEYKREAAALLRKMNELAPGIRDIQSQIEKQERMLDAS